MARKNTMHDCTRLAHPEHCKSDEKIEISFGKTKFRIG